jgi:hypothetical protein
VEWNRRSTFYFRARFVSIRTATDFAVSLTPTFHTSLRRSSFQNCLGTKSIPRQSRQMLVIRSPLDVLIVDAQLCMPVQASNMLEGVSPELGSSLKA